MKHKHLFSLLDSSFTTVHVQFGMGALPAGHYDVVIEDVEYHNVKSREGKMGLRTRFASEAGGRSYVYKAPKSWNMAEDDLALVYDPQGRLTVVTVIKVDSEPDIDLDADFDYKWLVQRVDTAEHDELVRKERSFHDHMVEVERVKQREALITSFRESLPAGSQARALFEATTGTLLDQPAGAPTAPDGPAPWESQQEAAPSAHPADPDEGHLR